MTKIFTAIALAAMLTAALTATAQQSDVAVTGNHALGGITGLDAATIEQMSLEELADVIEARQAQF
ncbi:hypothetical protein [Pontivivens ytuae]|uniref:Uncharacterized protein n=1 Tax=Pontivivens ytuae TaxID=2789856 RepID=A0A7S9LU79_9RHOB|nr:hypothetical protein [Pontivivens ytuae]QPH55412.1 hypothetical protein I0K15_06670 [Pontivivens ytuae]